VLGLTSTTGNKHWFAQPAIIIGRQAVHVSMLHRTPRAFDVIISLQHMSNFQQKMYEEKTTESQGGVELPLWIVSLPSDKITELGQGV
jgi:hypothetical protein